MIERTPLFVERPPQRPSSGSFGRIGRIIIGLVLGTVVAPLAIVVAIGSLLASGKHGHGEVALLLFPIPMLVNLVPSTWTEAVAGTLAVVQFPLYGVIMSWWPGATANRATVIVLSIHLLAAAARYTFEAPS